MFSSDYHEGFGGGPAIPGRAWLSPALKNALMVAFFLAYALGASVAFERALATVAQSGGPEPVPIAGL
jgi:hypothetical protein